MSVQMNGGVYGLRQTDPNKTVLLLKLTDSALRSLEQFHDASSEKSNKPLMEFKGNQGVMKIPVRRDCDITWQTFTFQLASLNQSSGFDCLQQNPDHIESLGSIERKVTVNATDDSYNETRKRMTKAKEEEQKNSTKVIKGPASKLGKRFPKRPSHRKLVEKKHGTLSDVATNSPESRVPTPPISRLTPTISINRSSSPLLSNQDSASKGGVTFRNKTKPVMISSNTSSNQPSLTNNGTIDRSIRKAGDVSQSETRKRPPSPKIDHEEYTNPVSKKQRVSHFNQKKTSPTEPQDDVNLEDLSSTLPETRSISPVKLKPGISFGVTKLPSKSESLSPQHFQNRTSNCKTSRVNRVSDISHSDGNKKEKNKDSNKRPGSLSLSSTTTSKHSESDVDTDGEDYLRKYTVIMSLDQRNNYKSDFNAEFEEYQNHHAQVQMVSERFGKYRKKLSECKKGTEKYEQIAKQVYKDYKKIKENKNYKHNRARLQYLHKKLDHIKQLVLIYDKENERSLNKKEDDKRQKQALSV